jgi:histone H4
LQQNKLILQKKKRKKQKQKKQKEMSGRGKGGKGIGKGGLVEKQKKVAGKTVAGAGGMMKRHQHQRKNRDAIQGVTKPAIKRLARRGGVKRLANGVYEEVRIVLRNYLKKVVHDALAYTEHAKRKTINVMDVVHALKQNGRTLYGFSN